MHRRLLWALSSAVALCLACTPPSGEGDQADDSTGGSAMGQGGVGDGTGGAPMGGEPALGGQTGDGGAGVQGGEPGAGGEPATGGAPNAGGAPAMGGEPAVGGEPAAGGDPVAGGEPAAGGEPDEGGAPAMGGEPAGGGEPGQGGEPGMPVAACPDPVVFTGQIGGDTRPDGGRPTLDPYLAQVRTGISAVLAAVPEESEVPRDVNIVVNGARVSATNYLSDRFDIPPSQSRFWVESAEGAIELFLDYRVAGATPPFAIRVGQTIAFTATRVMRYGDKPEVVAATDWVLLSEDDEVSMFEPGRDLSVGQVHRLVRVTGTVWGPGPECDRPGAAMPNRCWELDYGARSPAVLRTRSEFLAPGACVTYVGPLGWYEGRPNLDTVNYSWLRIY